MAGSYRHVMGRGGRWSLVENMGDAYETVEEMAWLIERAIGSKEATRLLAEFYRMKRGERPKDAALLKVELRMSGAPDDPRHLRAHQQIEG